MYNRKKENYKESDLENTVSKECKKRKIKYLKFYSRSNTGWPDRLLLFPNGITVWIEFKKPSGTLGALQRINGEWLVSNHHQYYQLWTREAVEEFIMLTLPALCKLKAY